MERNNNISFPKCHLSSLIGYGGVAAGVAWIFSKVDFRQINRLSWLLNLSCTSAMVRFSEGKRTTFGFRMLGASLIGVGFVQAIQALQLIRIERWTGLLDNALGVFAGIGLKIPVGVISFAYRGPALFGNEEALRRLQKENIGVFLDANAEDVRDIFSRYVQSEELLSDSQIEEIILATRGHEGMPIRFIYAALKSGDRVDCLKKLFQRIAKAPPLPGAEEQLKQKLDLFFEKVGAEQVNVEALLGELKELEGRVNQLDFSVQAISLWDRLTESNVLDNSNYRSLIGASVIQRAQEGYNKCLQVHQWHTSFHPRIKLKEAERTLLRKRPKVSAFSVIQDVFNSQEKLAILAKALGVAANEEAITQQLAEGSITTVEDVSDLLEDASDLQKVADAIAMEVAGTAFQQISAFFQGSEMGLVKEALGLSGDADYEVCCNKLISVNLRHQKDVIDLIGVTKKTGNQLKAHYLQRIKERVQQRRNEPQQEQPLLPSSQQPQPLRPPAREEGPSLPLKCYHTLLKTCFVGITALLVAEFVRNKKNIGYFATGIGLTAMTRGRLEVARKVAQEAFERRRQEQRGLAVPERLRNSPGLYRFGWRKLHHDTHFSLSVLGILLAVAGLRLAPTLAGAFLAGGLIGHEIGEVCGRTLAQRLSLEPQIHRVHSNFPNPWIAFESPLEEDAYDLLTSPLNPLEREMAHL
ncbi:MAG: hypothetical protein JSR80_07425 [Verrucomicrobia bacterium]|nr:hypothetical protein [Verrucomicrobiota bacterium]